MKKMITQTLDRKNQRGFTLVELATVIFVIGILMTITVTSFGAIQARNSYSIIDNDMKAMKLAIEKYYAKNGNYPQTGGSWQFRARDGINFIPGLSPDYYTNGPLPDVTSGSKTSSTANTYVYMGGVNADNTSYYKLIRYFPPSVPQFELDTSPAARFNACAPTDRWGYWAGTPNPC